jgi:hypothetical protein
MPVIVPTLRLPCRPCQPAASAVRFPHTFIDNKDETPKEKEKKEQKRNKGRQTKTETKKERKPSGFPHTFYDNNDETADLFQLADELVGRALVDNGLVGDLFRPFRVCDLTKSTRVVRDKHRSVDIVSS